MPFFGGSGQYVIVGTNIKGGTDAAPSVVGDDNMALGNGALQSAVNANRNIAIGNDALDALVSGYENVVIGDKAATASTGNEDTVIGANAFLQKVGGGNSVAVGNDAAKRATSATRSVIIGAIAGGYSVALDSSIIIGAESGNRVAFTQGSGIICIGTDACSVANCLTIGNSAIIWRSDNDDHIPENCINIGHSCVIQSTETNVIILGHNITASASDQIMIGDASHTSIIIGGLDFSGGPGGASTWGDISGTLSDQTDLQNVLDAKLDVTAARELLTANRTYYVATTGNDSNDGLTVGAPFLTVQKAVNTACGLDLSIYSVTIQCADGTYDGAIFLKPYLGTGPITIQGNTGNSSAVILNHSATTVGANSFSGRWDVKYVKITSGGNGVLSNLGSKVFVDSVVFGACAGYHMAAIQGAIVVSGNYTINGAAAAHWYVTGGGSITCSSKTITISGTPAFTYFAQSTQLGFMSVGGNTYSGSATGARYIANLNAVIDSGATTLPGNVAGSTATGGQYA